MTPQEELKSDSAIVLLQRIAKELTTIRLHTTTAVVAIRDAEAEIPERVRRFMNYFHDLHDIKFVYEEHGTDVPPWVMRELERCDDRYRQILEDLNAEGGAFNKVRRDMAADPNNRWDHTRLLAKPQETT